MSEYRDQGEGELVPGLGIGIVQILKQRRHMETIVELRSGEKFWLKEASYGRDIDAQWEHLYFDVDAAAYFLNTSEIARLFDPQSGAVLYQREAT